nr:hypothetical protein B0A51_03124 [Rachicladosporium sp. CCFEE 5018]
MPVASHQSIIAKVWNIGELQSQVNQCVADREKAITLKDKITDYRYPFKSSSNLILVSRATADQYCGALFFKALLNPESNLHFEVTDLEFDRISSFLFSLPSATLRVLSTQSEQRKRGAGESKIQAELLFTQRFVDNENPLPYHDLEEAEYATAHEQRRRHVHWSVYKALEIFKIELWKDEQLSVENIPDSWEDWKEK